MDNEEIKKEDISAERLINSEPKSAKQSKVVSSVKRNPWILVSIIMGIIILLLLFSSQLGLTGNITGRTISGDKAADSLITFLEDRVTGEITLDSVEDYGLFYEVNIEYMEDIIPLYITKDGKYYAPSLIPLVESEETSYETPSEETTEVPKSDKPVVELFVMSFCPYGNKAEDTMLPVYNLLKDKVDWNIHYIVSASGDTIMSLHGQPETNQNIREVCVLTEYGLDKFWEFTSYVNQNCGSKGDCWEDAAEDAGISINKIQSCFDEKGLDLMKKEAQISGEAGASGSPTLLINGVQSRAVYQYGNPEAYKQAICSAFNDAPKECGETLSGSTSTSSGGSC